MVVPSWGIRRLGCEKYLTLWFFPAAFELLMYETDERES